MEGLLCFRVGLIAVGHGDYNSLVSHNWNVLYVCMLMTVALLLVYVPFTSVCGSALCMRVAKNIELSFLQLV